jgi:hypothetical protein
MWLNYLDGLPIQELTISKIYVWPIPPSNRELWGTIPSLPQLQKLRLIYNHGKSDSGEPPLLNVRNFGELSHLEINGEQSWNRGDVFPGISKSIQHLIFHGFFGMQIARPWFLPFHKNLHRLFICRIKTEVPRVDLLFPNLRVLEIHWCSANFLSDATFPLLTHYSRSFIIEDQGQDFSFTSLIHQSQCLQTIVLRGHSKDGKCFNLPNGDLQFLQGLKGLQNLSVEGQLQVSDPEWHKITAPNGHRVNYQKDTHKERQKRLASIDITQSLWETEAEAFTEFTVPRELYYSEYV